MPLTSTSPDRPLGSRRGWLVAAYLAALVVGAAAQLHAPGADLVWAAFGVAALLLAGSASRRRRAVDAAGIAVVTLLAGLAFGSAAGESLTLAVAVAVGAVAVVEVAERVGGRPLALGRLTDLPVLALAAAGGALASLVVVAVAGAATGTPVSCAESLVWVVRVAVSVLVVTGVGLRLLARGGSPSAVSAVEQAAVWVTSALAFGYVFGLPHALPITYLVLPFAVWAALRLPSRMAALHLLAACATAVVGTLAGAGPFGALVSTAAQGRLVMPGAGVTADAASQMLLAEITVQGYVAALAVVVLLIALSRDALVAERARADAALVEASEQRDLLTGVLEGANRQAIIAITAEYRITLFSSGAETMLGWRAEEVLGETPLRFYDPQEMVERAAELGVPADVAVATYGLDSDGHAVAQWTAVRKDGSRLRVLVTLSPRLAPDGAVSGYVGVLTDISAQVEAEHRLAESEDLFRTAFEVAPTGLVVVSLSRGTEGRIREVNESFCRFTGRTEAELLRHRLAELMHEDDAPVHLEYLARAVAGGEPEPDGVERRFITPDGEVRWARKSTSVISPTDGRDPYLLAVIEDVTDRHAAEEALFQLAMHDVLTGLPNRALLGDRLERALVADERLKTGVTVIYADLDGFKPVNDSHGHAAGDLLLVEVAKRLERTLRTGDTVARMGGDEFAILCPGLASPQVPIVLERLQRAMALPVRLPGGAVVRVGLSTGVATAVGGDDAARLIDEADQAMFVAKRRRKLDAAAGLPSPRTAPLPALTARSAVPDPH